MPPSADVGGQPCDNGSVLEVAIGRLREATRRSAYENQIYIVGGYVRDRSLGIPPAEDLDLVLEGNACEFATFLFKRGVSSHPPVLYPRFGTARIQVEGVPVEIVGARRETYDPFSRKPEVKQGTLRDDALRRDFTVNTLLENLHTGERSDPLGRGLRDLEQRVLVTPQDPARTFHEDPLRMMRAVRLANRLGFRIAEECEQAIKENAGRLKIVSGERIRDELVKMLSGPSAANSLRDLERLGLLAVFAPELQAMKGVEQNYAHLYDVWEHTLKTLEALPEDASLVLRLAALLHDVGKPDTRSVDEKGRTHFYNHQVVGVAKGKTLLRRLRFSNDIIADVLQLVRMHMRPGGYGPHWTDGAVRRLVREAGPLYSELIKLCRADAATRNPEIGGPDLDGLESRVAEVEAQFRALEARSPLSGKEIMEALNLSPGSEVGHLKARLTEAVLDGRLQPGDKERALEMLFQITGSADKSEVHTTQKQQQG